VSIDQEFPPPLQSHLKPNELGVYFRLSPKDSRVHRTIKKNNEWMQWFYGNHSVSMTNFRCIEDGSFYAIEYESTMKNWLKNKLTELQIIKKFEILVPPVDRGEIT
jgi:hypothetical protein